MARRRGRRRAQVFAALAVVGLAVFVAVASALHAQPATVGVAAAETTRVLAVTRTLQVGGVRFTVTRKPNGDVCYAAPAIHSCTSAGARTRLSYATGRARGRQVVGGVVGPKVRAVILKLTGKGTIWPHLQDGAFYATLPARRRLRAIVKVVAGGKRVTFPA